MRKLLFAVFLLPFLVDGQTNQGVRINQTPVFFGTNGDCLTISSSKVSQAACGGAPSGAAGGSLSGTYPNPGLAVGALPNGMTATTQAMSDNTTKVATDAFVLANSSGALPAGSLGSVQLYATSSTLGSDVVFFDNWVSLATPAAPMLTCVGPACPGVTTWGYQITFYNFFGNGPFSTETQIMTGPATLTTTNKISIASPTCPAGVTQWGAFRSTGTMAQPTTLLNPQTCGTPLVDDGTAQYANNITLLDNSRGIQIGDSLAVKGANGTGNLTEGFYLVDPTYAGGNTLQATINAPPGAVAVFQPNPVGMGGLHVFAVGTAYTAVEFEAGYDGTVANTPASSTSYPFQFVTTNGAGPTYSNPMHPGDGLFSIGTESAFYAFSLITPDGTNASLGINNKIPTAALDISPPTTAIVIQKIREIGSQTANDWEIRSSADVVLDKFSAGGQLGLMANVVNPFIMAKNTQAATAPGAGNTDLRSIQGTGSTCNLVYSAGTTATEVVVAMNVGGGC